jgi:hypothetical protein
MLAHGDRLPLMTDTSDPTDTLTEPASPSAREQRRAAKLAAREQKSADRAARAYERSPAGQAATAYAAGDRFFQIQLPVSALRGGASVFGSSSNLIRNVRGATDTLGQIEEQGWNLEHTGYVFVETGSTSTNRALSTGQGTVTRGQVVGVYLFRRDDAARAADADAILEEAESESEE